MFHLKSNADKKADDEEIFDAIVDVGIVLQQQGEMPWIRATSASVVTLKEPGNLREQKIPTQDLVFTLSAIIAAASSIEIDFVRPAEVLSEQPAPSTWQYVWQKVGLCIKTSHISPQIATLSWFHSF